MRLRSFIFNNVKVKVYEYLKKEGRYYIFLASSSGHEYESFIRVKGRKKINLRKLFLRTNLQLRDLDCTYLVPDREYEFDLTDNEVTSKKKRV